MTAMNGPTEMDALITLKTALADQYSIATHHNRQINQKRALYRSIAGIVTLFSIAGTLWVVTRTMLYYIPH